MGYEVQQREAHGVPTPQCKTEIRASEKTMSPQKLESYRGQLMQLRERLRDSRAQRMDNVQEQIGDPGASTTAPTHLADQDSEGVTKDVAIGDAQEGVQVQVNSALARIDGGTYGKCENCGSEIEEVRLDAIPYTAYCAACAQQAQS